MQTTQQTINRRRSQSLSARHPYGRLALAITLCLAALPTAWGAPAPPAEPQPAEEVLQTDAAMRPAVDSQRLAPVPATLQMPELAAQFMDLEATFVPQPGMPEYDAGDRGGPSLDIGYVALAPPMIFELAPWMPTPDGGWVKKIELRSIGATALRVIMTDIGDLALRVYDPYSDAVFGPYTHPRLQSDGTFWSTMIFGDTIGLEFHHRPSADSNEPPPEDLVEILHIFHMYADFEGMLLGGRDGGCMIDISCRLNWKNSIEGRAVALLAGSTGCTGALLNRFPTDHAPILMTARHCIQNQNEANLLIVFWAFETDFCDGSAPPLNSIPRNDGALLLKTHQNTDWTLLGLYEPDQSGNYCGWTSAYWEDDSSASGIHHPGGMPKSISFGTKVDDTECGPVGSTQQWHVDWDQGAITGGSSGSPIFDLDRRIRGTLSCGSCEPVAGPRCDVESRQHPCSPLGLYGRLDSAIGILRWYITGMASPTYVNRDVSGDPGNQGSSERGTSSLPFNTVYEGTFCVPEGGTVRIKPGSYNERFTLWRPMRLEPSQAGIVRIGQ